MTNALFGLLVDFTTHLKRCEYKKLKRQDAMHTTNYRGSHSPLRLAAFQAIIVNNAETFDISKKEATFLLKGYFDGCL